MSIRRRLKPWAPVLFAAMLSGIMSGLVSGISTFRSGSWEAIQRAWLPNWGMSWLIAFPIVLIVAPGVRRAVDWMTTEPDAA